MNNLQVVFACMLILLATILVKSQAKRDFEKVYGQSVENKFHITDDIVMVCDFNTNGQVIKASVFVTKGERSSERQLMSLTTAKKAVRRLLMITKRGKLTREFVFSAGCTSLFIRKYQFLTVTFTTVCSNASPDLVETVEIIWKRVT
jgi:hypothetical protein